MSIGIALLAILGGTSNAEIVAFEGFDVAGTEDVTNGIYKAARSMHLQTTVKGGNIVGMGTYDWALSTATGAFTTQAGSLSSGVSGAESTGRMDVNVAAGGSFASRALTRQLDAAPAQSTFYVSGILSAAALETESAGIGGVMGFTDGNAGVFYSPSSFDGLLFGFRGDGSNADLVLWGGGSARTILQDVSSNTTYHVVAEVIFNAAGNETVNVWVNPSAGTPQETPDFTTSTGDFADALSDFSYASVYIRSKSAITTSLDELTLATKYSDLIPALPSAEILAFDGFEAASTEDVTNGIYKATRSMNFGTQPTVKGGTIVGMGTYDWALSAATGAFTVQSGSLSSGFFGSASTGRLSFDVAAGGLASRALTRQLDEVPMQSTLYMSGMLSGSSLETVSTGIGGIMGFTDGNAGSFWSANSFDGLMFGFRGDGSNADLVLWGGGAARTILEDVSSNATYHVVAQVIFNAAGNETVNVWLNPTSRFPQGAPDYTTSSGDYADALSDFSYASVYTRVQSAVGTGFDELTLYAEAAPAAEPFDEIEDPAINLLTNGDLTQSANETTGGLATYRVTGSNGDYPSNDGNYADVVGWTHYHADPNALATYTDPGEVLDGTDKLSTSFKPASGLIYLNSAMDYRNGMMQSDALNSGTINPDATYKLSIDVAQNSSKDNSLTTFTAALTSGADETNTAQVISGSLLQVAADTLPTASGTPYTRTVSGADLVSGQVNVIFDSVNTDTITGFPAGPVDTDDPDEMSQVVVSSVSLVYVPVAGDVNKDGVVDQSDVDLAQHYLDGAGGEPATNRQDSLIASGMTPAEALAYLNLTDFDINGDDRFDADDVTAILAMIPPAMLQMAINGSGLDFAWNSKFGFTYDLESSPSLAPASWEGYSSYTNMPASGTGSNTLNGVAIDGSVRFFRLIEKN